MKSKKNYFEILQVDKNASPEIIKNAYRTLLKDLKLHPDMGGSGIKARMITEAYETLKNPDSRKKYIESLHKDSSFIKLKSFLTQKQKNINIYIQEKPRLFKKSFIIILFTVAVLFLVFTNTHYVKKLYYNVKAELAYQIVYLTDRTKETLTQFTLKDGQILIGKKIGKAGNNHIFEIYLPDGKRTYNYVKTTSIVNEKSIEWKMNHVKAISAKEKVLLEGAKKITQSSVKHSDNTLQNESLLEKFEDRATLPGDMIAEISKICSEIKIKSNDDES